MILLHGYKEDKVDTLLSEIFFSCEHRDIALLLWWLATYQKFLETLGFKIPGTYARRGWDSSVGVAICYGLDGPEIESR
jgi:hypothetical protein